LDGFKVQPDGPKVPSVDIKSWDIQKFFIVYQTFALSQIVKLTIVTLTSLSCKINSSLFNEFRFDKLSNLSKSVHTLENSQILTV
jgi:hypothetical protein